MTKAGAVDYARMDNEWARHHTRYVRFIDSMPRKLICQECGGVGGYTEACLDDGSGPFFGCGVCESTGYVTPWMRGQWLRWKREEAKEGHT